MITPNDLRERMNGSELTELVIGFVALQVDNMPEAQGIDDVVEAAFSEAESRIKARDIRLIERVLLAVAGTVTVGSMGDERADAGTLTRIVQMIVELAKDFPGDGEVDAFV